MCCVADATFPLDCGSGLFLNFSALSNPLDNVALWYCKVKNSTDRQPTANAIALLLHAISVMKAHFESIYTLQIVQIHMDVCIAVCNGTALSHWFECLCCRRLIGYSSVSCSLILLLFVKLVPCPIKIKKKNTHYTPRNG